MARFAVRLTPRAGTDRIDGVDEAGALLVRVTAAPVDGAANEALLLLLARELHVARRELLLVVGGRNRNKVIELSAALAARAALLWPGLRT